MTYVPYHADWKDFPDTTTPITAAALEYIEAGITSASTPSAVPLVTESKTGDFTASTAVDVYLIEASGQFVFATLPSAAASTGEVITFRRVGANAGFNVAVVGTIDGISGRNLYRPGEWITVSSDGSSWYTLNQFGPQPSQSQFYVDGLLGNDSNTGRSWQESFQTITHAVSVAVGRCNIYIAGGTYTESVNLVNHTKTSLIGVPSGVGSGVYIKAPSVHATTVTMGEACELHNLCISGSGVAGWDGIALLIENFSSCLVKGCTIANPDGTMPANPGADPVTGGTGIRLDDTENNTFEQTNVTEFRRAIWVEDSGNGVAQCVFRKMVLSRNWQEMYFAGNNGSHIFESIKCVNPLMPDTVGFVWDVGSRHCTFINCELTEGSIFFTYKARFVEGSPGSGGGGHVFICCENATDCAVYFETDANHLIDWFAQSNASVDVGNIYLNGDRNKLDHMVGGNNAPTTGKVVVNGARNELWRTDVTEIEDNSNSTRYDGVFRGTVAPVSGTWIVGDTVWNSAPAAGSPAGWVCTVAGTPGTWKAMANLA